MNNKKQKIIDCLFITIIFLCFIFLLIVVPVGVAYGVINGKLDIETLEPTSVQEQIRDETMIQGGFGGY